MDEQQPTFGFSYESPLPSMNYKNMDTPVQISPLSIPNTYNGDGSYCANSGSSLNVTCHDKSMVSHAGTMFGGEMSITYDDSNIFELPGSDCDAKGTSEAISQFEVSDRDLSLSERQYSPPPSLTVSGLKSPFMPDYIGPNSYMYIQQRTSTLRKSKEQQLSSSHKYQEQVSMPPTAASFNKTGEILSNHFYSTCSLLLIMYYVCISIITIIIIIIIIIISINMEKGERGKYYYYYYYYYY